MLLNTIVYLFSITEVGHNIFGLNWIWRLYKQITVYIGCALILGNILACSLWFIYKPISFETFINLASLRAINTILIPRSANCFAYSFPMPSVEPVTTNPNLKINYSDWLTRRRYFQNKMDHKGDVVAIFNVQEIHIRYRKWALPWQFHNKKDPVVLIQSNHLAVVKTISIQFLQHLNVALFRCFRKKLICAQSNSISSCNSFLFSSPAQLPNCWLKLHDMPGCRNVFNRFHNIWNNDSKLSANHQRNA